MVVYCQRQLTTCSRITISWISISKDLIDYYQLISNRIYWETWGNTIFFIKYIGMYNETQSFPLQTLKNIKEYKCFHYSSFKALKSFYENLNEHYRNLYLFIECLFHSTTTYEAKFLKRWSWLPGAVTLSDGDHI